MNEPQLYLSFTNRNELVYEDVTSLLLEIEDYNQFIKGVRHGHTNSHQGLPYDKDLLPTYCPAGRRTKAEDRIHFRSREEARANG